MLRRGAFHISHMAHLLLQPSVRYKTSNGKERSVSENRLGRVLNFINRGLTLLLHGLILWIFFSASWWWRPRWIYADWVPSQFNAGLLQPSHSAPYLADYYARYALTMFIVLLIILWALNFFRGAMRIFNDGRIWWVMALTLLTFWAWFSTSWVGDYPAGMTLDYVERMVAVSSSQATQWLLALGFAVVVICAGPPQRWILVALVGGMLVQASLGIVQSAFQHTAGLAWLDDELLKVGLGLREYNYDPAQSGAPVIQSVGIRYLRAYGLTPHPNLLAGGLVMGLAAALGLWWRESTRRIAGLITVVGLWALLLTFSRAGLGGYAVAIGSAVILGFWTLPRRQWREMLTLGLLVVLVSGLFYLMFRPLVDVRAGQGEEGTASVEDMSVQARAVYLDHARQMIEDNPIKGVGIGAFPWVSHHYLQSQAYDLPGDNVHRVYYLAAAELGIIGWGLVLATFVSGAWLVWQRGQQRQLTPEAIGLIAGIIGWLAIGWFEFFPWSLFTHQVLFWGVFAAALKPEDAHATD